MEQPLITVIIPVYKAEAYLSRCIESVANQTYNNLEIILVDDGSPDRCGEICDEFAQKDERIKVFHKENGGQSSARNLGLDNMCGEYVGFVDSDDWIEPNMYEHLYNLLKDKDAQIAACGTNLEHLNGETSYFNLSYPAEKEIRVYTMREALVEIFENQRITYSPCDKLYSSNVFSSIRMTVGRIYEDMEIIPKCIEKTERIVYDPTPLYHYNLTEESTIRGAFNPKRFAEAEVAREKADDYAERFPELWVKAEISYIEICLQLIHSSKGVKGCEEQRRQFVKEIREKKLSKVWYAMSRNTKIKLYAIKLSPVLYEWLMRAYEFVFRGKR